MSAATTVTWHRYPPGTVSRPMAFGSDGTTTAFLAASQFDGVYHLLQSESPVYFTALSLFGIRAFDLSTGDEPTGEGPADHDAPAQFMRDARGVRRAAVR